MKKIVILAGLIASSYAFSNYSTDNFWQDVQNKAEIQYKSIAEISLKKRALFLDESGLKEALIGAGHGLSYRTSDIKSKITEVDLPLPNGGFIRVSATPSSILSPELTEQYPEIKTWQVQGLDDAAITGRLDFTAKGFHGMLSMPDGDTVFIDPDKSGASHLYQSLSKRENQRFFNTEFDCKLPEDHSLHSHQLSAKKLAQIPAPDLITYRLALAGTAEYTNSQGGTAASAYASMITTINRVNQLYQRDLGVKFEIVSNESLAYLDADTDPYTNGNAESLIAENIDNINASFGAAKYDIGHVFAQGALGGLAYVGSACYDGYKAGGATGIPNPQGEIFSIEYVSHEMGHQLGANHTFNSEKNSCGAGARTQEAAVEPGSGSTIMSYSGLCGADNIQTGSDPMFHWRSIQQINGYTRSGNGASCGAKSSAGQNPTANSGGNGIVPLNTPFFLDGTATGGSLFAWDQMDTGSVSSVDVDMGNNAIIRSLTPTSEQGRYIPRLSDLFAGTHTVGEKLPDTVRDVNFAFVVRDGSGGIASASKRISVKDTGAIFQVFSQHTAETFTTGQTASISWNTGNTSASPINCNKVDIQLLRVDGTKNMLLENTDNDGTEEITVPASTPEMTNARLMLACHTQPFFQISSGNVTVKKGAAAADKTPPVISIIGELNVTIPKGASYTDKGATATDNVDGALNAVATGTVNTAVVGMYTITYTATDAAGNKATAIRTINVISDEDTTPPRITLNGPSLVEVEQGSSYVDAGATAVDNVDAVVSVSVTGSVDTSKIGTYLITYNAIDKAGNNIAKIRTVKVVKKVILDTTPPVIKLTGSSTVSVEKGTEYIELGASAIDQRDGTVTVVVTGAVDINKVGSYTVTYSAMDKAENKAVATRTVNVTNAPDIVKPEIKLEGESTLTLEAGAEFVDPGASAFDDRDGIIKVVVTGSVDTQKAGTYTLTYTAIDAAGNTFVLNRTIVITEKKEDTGKHEDDKKESSGGGSFGYLLFPLGLLGLRRRKK